jgi:hypothetical protein
MSILSPEDDYFHKPDGNLLWNESAWFHVSVPERGIGGFVHMGHRPNMKASITGVGLYDAAGSEIYDCLHHNYGEFHPIAGTEMFDFASPNGLSVRIIEPLQSYGITYDRDGIQMDLTWTGSMPAYGLGFEAGSEGWGPSHYEQAGLMTGTITIHGEDIPVHCGSNRDHSWGVRDYQSRTFEQFPRHDYPWFNDANGYSMNMYTIPNDPPSSDPIVGVTDKLLSGWVLKDGEVARITSGTRKAVERRADGVALITVVDGRDELGRDFAAEGRMKSVIKWTGLPSLTVFWAFTEWTLDSGQKVYGETGEVFPAAFGRRFLRSGVAR